MGSNIDTEKKFGAKLAYIRKSKKLSQIKLAEMVDKWCKKMEVEEATWIVKQMKTRWGSCVESKKLIQLNLELARLPRRCIEYVVVHELCHLRVHGHNRMFENLISQYLPNWKSLRKELNGFVALPMEV